MAGQSIGTVFVELDLDPSRYTKSQQRLYKDATSTSLSIEENFKKLNIKSAAEFDLLRQKATNSYEMIKNSALATSNDILRAEKAKNDTITKLNEQQFGKQESLLESIKRNWLAAAAVIYTAISAIGTAWDLAKQGADFDEQFGLLDNLARKYSTTADSIIDNMRRASDELIADSDLMQVALGGIAKGLKPEQLINLADAARVLGDVVGKDATTALKELTEALETGRTRGLKTYLGSALDLESVFGKLTNKMTEAEKAQAMYNLTMIEATKLQAEQVIPIDDTADAIERLEAKYKNVTTALGRFMKELVVSAMEAYKVIDIMHGIAEPEEETGFQTEVAGAPFVKMGMPKPAGSTEKYQSALDKMKSDLAKREDDDSKKSMDRMREQADYELAKAQETLTAKTELEKFMANDLEMALYDMRQARLESETGFSQKRIELRQWEHDAALLIARQEADEEIRIEKEKAEVQKRVKQSAIDNAKAALQYFGKENKAAFAAFKAVSIAETVINTYKAAVGAYSAMASNPLHRPCPWRCCGCHGGRLWHGAGPRDRFNGARRRTRVFRRCWNDRHLLSEPLHWLPDFRLRDGRGKKSSLTINIEGDMIGDESYIEKLAEKISAAVENRDVRLVATNSKYATVLA